MSTDEFVSAVCRRNTVEDPIVPKYNSWMQREDPSLFRRACDGGARPKVIDPCGYHFVGCKTAANAIRLHDEVVAVVAWLFRSLRLDVIVEPTSLFGDNLGDVSNQRPDIHIRNPRKSRQVIIAGVRKNRWSKVQIIPLCNLSVFSHLLIIKSLQRLKRVS